MIYIDESLIVIEDLLKAKTALPMNEVISNSELKEQEIRQILSYMLYQEYIDFNNNNISLTSLGSTFYIAFQKRRNKTLEILLKLRENFPKALMKKDANPGLSSSEYRDIIWFLRERNYIEPISNKPLHELLRITDYGFQVLDLFEYRSKLNKILD